LYIYDPAAIIVGAGLPAMLFRAQNTFPIAHHFVTERPSVAQNHAQVTIILPRENSPEKFHLPQNP
jgi:hypothetical protein